MGFDEFRGNQATVNRLREMIARDHLPHAIILTGLRGSGKYTLAQMVAKAVNCLERPVAEDGLPDFCGRCRNCERIAQADALEQRFEEAVDARENLRDSDKRETRIFVQTHPEVLVIPPDPPQMLVKVDQVRHVIGEMYYRPVEGRQKFYIFSEASFMKEAANALLKVLEEPPEFATLFLLAENANSLLPTIRSRCITLRLAPLAPEEIAADLALRPEWTSAQKKLVAQLAGGAVGRARGFDLAGYLGARKDALLLLTTALGEGDHAALFKATEAYRAGGEGKAKTDQLIAVLYSLLEDLIFLKSGTAELMRNQDMAKELSAVAAQVSFAWLVRASEGLGDVQNGMRRNLLRSLSLDGFSSSLER
ncbi:MAG: DNA polymerase III subunit delta' [Acidobacteriota bacterium]|nr:DNA polymerase III subunit delta' [Acidobacteriota bacterium]